MLKASTLALLALAMCVATAGGVSITTSPAMAGCIPGPGCGEPPPPPGGDGTNDPYVPPPPPPPGGREDARYSKAIECAIDDEAPVSDDFFIVNVGSAELPAGLKIRFEIPSTGERGAFLLPRSVAAGQKVRIADLLHGVDANAECRAIVIT